MREGGNRLSARSAPPHPPFADSTFSDLPPHWGEGQDKRPKTFPLEGGRWPAGPDEGASQKWFGAPSRRAPQNRVVPCRHGGRLIAAPTPTCGVVPWARLGSRAPRLRSPRHPERQRRIRFSRIFRGVRGREDGSFGPRPQKDGERGVVLRPVHPLSPAKPDSSPVQGERCGRAGSSRPTTMSTLTET